MRQAIDAIAHDERMLVEPLSLTMPMAAFNGGAIVLPDLSVLDERTLPEYLLPALVDMLQSHGLDVWLFRSSDWFVRSLSAPRVSRETSNIRQPPVVVGHFDEMPPNVVKMVGVSEDHARVAAVLPLEVAAHEQRHEHERRGAERRDLGAPPRERDDQVRTGARIQGAPETGRRGRPARRA